MTRYRATFTYSAASDEAAALHIPSLAQLPPGSTLKIENLDRSRTIRLAAILAGALILRGSLVLAYSRVFFL